MEVRAPAKVNLTLVVRGKRDDNFHEIETLIVPISLYDTLTFARAAAFSFTCDEPGIPSDESNLVVRAATLFCSRAGIAPGVRIRLHKTIPHGAGLGGGSSDAAATLLALNRFFGCELPPGDLAEIAAGLGSDVPVFLTGGAAVCRGRGERVEPVSFSHRLPLLLLKPPFGVPTPWAYRQWRDSRELPGVRYRAQEFPWGRLLNDLERPVFEKFLLLPALKNWLLAQPGVSGALMSGSGSTIFAVLEDASRAAALAEDARRLFGETLWTFSCDAGEI